MSKLEDELLKDDVTLDQKSKKLNHLESLARELWPTEANGIRKATIELSGIVDALPETLAGGVLAEAPGLAKWLMGVPFDLVMSHLRRRKIRPRSG